MATINPLVRPIDYTVDVQSPFESALGGFKLGAGVAEVQASQQKRELELVKELSSSAPPMRSLQ